MRSTLFALAFLAVASAAAAQAPVTPRLELRPMAGALIPTGAQRDLFKTSALWGGQAAVEVTPTFHIVGTFAWSRSHNKFNVSDDAGNTFQYDLGTEFNLVRSLGSGWDLKPFLGLGAGARTYNYDAISLDTKTCFAGYGTIGTEFQYSFTAFRLEARDNVYCYKYPDRDLQKTRNDLGFSAGVAFHVGM